MDPVSITIGTSWTITGLLCLALAIPLARGMVGRNRLYGVRFAESFHSDEAWFTINRFGGWRMILWSMPMISAGVVSFFLPLQARPNLALTLGLLPLVFVLIPLVESWRFARWYSKQ